MTGMRGGQPFDKLQGERIEQYPDTIHTPVGPSPGQYTNDATPERDNPVASRRDSRPSLSHSAVAGVLRCLAPQLRMGQNETQWDTSLGSPSDVRYQTASNSCAARMRPPPTRSSEPPRCSSCRTRMFICNRGATPPQYGHRRVPPSGERERRGSWPKLLRPARPSVAVGA